MEGGGQIKIKTVKIEEFKSLFPLIYIFGAFLFIFTFSGDDRGVTGKVEIRDRCLMGNFKMALKLLCLGQNFAKN